MSIFGFFTSLFNEHVILLRTIVYTFGWAVLSISTVIITYRAVKFYRKSRYSSLGKLILPLMFGWLVTMHSLGAVCTFYVFDMPRKGMIVTFPIFLVWMVTMVVVYIIASKWGLETIQRYDETIRLNQELETAKGSLINMLEDAESVRKKVQEEESKTRATLVSLTDGLIVFDKDKRITLVNPEAEKILELKETEVLNRKIGDVLNFSNLNELYQILGKKVEWTGQKYELILKKPIKRYFQVSIAPVVVGKETVGLMVILHDVTRGKEIERLKTEFVSIAAHQLRTPLSAVKWTLRMLLDGDVGNLTTEQIEFLTKGYQSNERMIVLINDLLSVARIEEGRFIYDLTPQSLEEIVKEAVDGLAGIVKEKKIELIYKKSKKKLPKVNIDKEKISIVIQNLLDNAIRFNKYGGKVTASVDCDKVNLEVTVKDNGIGIPQEQQKRIFNKFFRADNAIKTETEGTGLGLFIVKNIIKAHNGKIWFESKKGQGTTFRFSLPIKS